MTIKFNLRQEIKVDNQPKYVDFVCIMLNEIERMQFFMLGIVCK